VFDATAGHGRDALVLARLGCRVFACETIPALAMIHQDTARLADHAERVDLVCGDATERLPGVGGVDVVLLDPMFPEPGRAQVKKEMQVCRLLAGPAGDNSALFAGARAAARDRVVVKRHPHEQPLADSPSFSVEGDRVRFDVYLRPTSPDTRAQ
jgi:16S rRNA (guanine1516-N2)-methyltransferase